MEGTPAPKVSSGGHRKAGYKSWKKKYRKMRIVFDQKMHEGEDIFKQEEKAQALVKRLATENDRLLDLLLHINNSPQIPLEKRIDVSLPQNSDPKQLSLEIDEEHEARKDTGTKHLLDLVQDVPHLSYGAAKESQPSLVEDLEPLGVALAGWPENQYPPHFLTPDDVDNYLYTIDRHIDPGDMLPTLAPLAHPSEHPPVHPALQNPNSSINWLRRHAPHIFLQGGHEDGHEEDKEGKVGSARPRKPRKSGAAKEDKHDKAATLAAASGHDADSMDDDGYSRSTPLPKGKRKRDDDPGYRPKGGSSRPTKKKRKSEGDTGPKRTKKESLGSRESMLESRD